MGGNISRIQLQLPMQEELDNCQWIDLTGEQEWDPYPSSFAEDEQIMEEQEQGYEQEDQHICSMRTILRREEEEHECFKSRILLSVSSTLCVGSLYKAALDTVQIMSK